MKAIVLRLAAATAVIGFLGVLSGCGEEAEPKAADAGGDATAQADSRQPPEEDKPRFAPLDLDGGGEGAGGSSKTPRSGEQQAQTVLDKMQPLQLVLGTWRGTTRRKVGQFNAVEEVQWVWDFKTDETQPALVMTTKTGAYLKEGRLTYLPDQDQFQFTATDNDGARLNYVGTFTVEPHAVADGGQTEQRAFKLELERESSEPAHKLAKVVFNQQENNRYLLELYNKGGARYDTVATQRQGTSFAVSEDYGEKECIISQGLGTITIEHKGKTYWVCCTGCEAAFNEDPDKWIAKATAREQMKK